MGIGGIFGAISRYRLGKIISDRSSSAFPVGTFLINLSGALALGVLTGMETGNSVSLLLGDGFLGAFTTFSTLMYEGVHLFEGSEKRNAAVYIAATLILGIAGYALGWSSVCLLRMQ